MNHSILNPFTPTGRHYQTVDIHAYTGEENYIIRYYTKIKNPSSLRKWETLDHVVKEIGRTVYHPEEAPGRPPVEWPAGYGQGEIVVHPVSNLNYIICRDDQDWLEPEECSHKDRTTCNHIRRAGELPYVHFEYGEGSTQSGHEITSFQFDPRNPSDIVYPTDIADTHKDPEYTSFGEWDTASEEIPAKELTASDFFDDITIKYNYAEAAEEDPALTGNVVREEITVTWTATARFTGLGGELLHEETKTIQGTDYNYYASEAAYRRGDSPILTKQGEQPDWNQMTVIAPEHTEYDQWGNPITVYGWLDPSGETRYSPNAQITLASGPEEV